MCKICCLTEPICARVKEVHDCVPCDIEQHVFAYIPTGNIAISLLLPEIEKSSINFVNNIDSFVKMLKRRNEELRQTQQDFE